jgi:hypothetical protein
MPPPSCKALSALISAVSASALRESRRLPLTGVNGIADSSFG